MQDLLSPKQLAEYLQLSQRTVYRLLERGDLPGFKVGGQWRFRKSTVDEWLDVDMRRMDAAALEALDGDEGTGTPAPRLADLLIPENARIDVDGASRDDAIRSFMHGVRFPESVAADLVADRVLERERLCSTALSGGTALLHTGRRHARLLHDHDLVAIGRMATPLDFGAMDGGRTDILVLVLARTERDQLALLAKLTRLCQEPGFQHGLRAATTAAQVIELVRTTADRLFAATR